MNKQGKAGAVLDSAAKFASDIVKKVKKMDKRMLLMIAAAFVLVIIILSLIIHGVSAGKNKEKPSGNAVNSGSVVNVNDPSTNDDAANNSTPKINGTGKYKVSTGFDSPLNMRLAADRNSQVLATIPNDTVLEVLFVDDSEVQNPGDYGWGYVEYKGERGWVFMEYLKAAQ